MCQRRAPRGASSWVFKCTTQTPPRYRGDCGCPNPLVIIITPSAAAYVACDLFLRAQPHALVHACGVCFVKCRVCGEANATRIAIACHCATSAAASHRGSLCNFICAPCMRIPFRAAAVPGHARREDARLTGVDHATRTTVSTGAIPFRILGLLSTAPSIAVRTPASL